MHPTVLNLPRVLACLVAVCPLTIGVRAAEDLRTPLERAEYSRISKSAEVSAYLQRLQASSPFVRYLLLGRSAGARVIEALFISEAPGAWPPGARPETRLTVLLIGTQHGTEPSGGEALLVVAREILHGSLRSLLRDGDFILVPNANPDGRDLRKRVNANGVNLSTDFVLLSQPESRVLNDLLLRMRPEVVLDVHESAAFKGKSLGREGFMTDFEAQFEIANNPNVDAEVRALSLGRLLPAILERCRARGLPAERYIGEITSTRQPVTNGGLSLKNLRNKAGFLGAFSFLVENRLDPRAGQYATYRNIRVRANKQLIGIVSFLEVVQAYRQEILARVTAMRRSNHAVPTTLYAGYQLDQQHPRVAIPLVRIDNGERVPHWFADHRAVQADPPVARPAAYVITRHGEQLKPVFDRQGIRYRAVDRALETPAVAQRMLEDSVVHLIGTKAVTMKNTEAYSINLAIAPGALRIDLAQPYGALAPLLLEPRSASSIFQSAGYAALLPQSGDHFVYRIE